MGLNTSLTLTFIFTSRIVNCVLVIDNECKSNMQCNKCSDIPFCCLVLIVLRSERDRSINPVHFTPIVGTVVTAVTCNFCLQLSSCIVSKLPLI